MLVRELMTSAVTSVAPWTAVGEALDLMFEHKISALPVVEEGRCIGIVTATDLLVLLRATDKLLPADPSPDDDCLWAIDLIQRKLVKDPVREIMSEVVLTTAPDAAIDQVARLMSEESVHHLPVVENSKLVGLLSSLDFVRAWPR
jgi:CBS domain-containing protein